MWLSTISVTATVLINRKNTYWFSPVFFMLSTVKSLEILPKHNRYAFISECFGLYWYIFTPLSYKNCYFYCNADLNKIFFLVPAKLLEYLASAAIVILSNPCVGPSPRTKVSFFSIISMFWRTIIYTKHNNIFTPIKICN